MFRCLEIGPLLETVREAKEKSDFTIVFIHWGTEGTDALDHWQMEQAPQIAEAGADLIIGAHPHVLQPMEQWGESVILYSMGNFCFGGNSAPSDMDSMIFQQTFTISNDGVKADNVTNIIPCSISSAYGYNNYQPTPAEGDEKTRIMEKIQERSSWIG